MIIGEEPSDGGEIILAKGRSIGYLAQHQNLIPNGTIYEELRSAKADIIEMEQQLRSIEHELQSLSGEELNARLETYNRLQSQFESQNGYACESEIIGVLKGLGFTEEEFSKKQILYPVDRKPVSPSGNFFLPIPTSCSSTSLQTI